MCESCSIRGVAWGVLAWLCIGLLKAAWDHLYGGWEEEEKKEMGAKRVKRVIKRHASILSVCVTSSHLCVCVCAKKS